MISNFVRRKISRYFTGENEIAFSNRIPSDERIGGNIKDVDNLGIYLHIPFCDQICPYCPYNKEIFNEAACSAYSKAVKKEIDYYSELLGNKQLTSFYIGGGTPTTMLGRGIQDIIDHIYKRFSMRCKIHMESHPNHLSAENLGIMEAMGVNYLSVGVEALQDRHLKFIERPYSVSDVKRNVERAAGRSFECVNIDYIFDLPGQTEKEVEEAGMEMVKLGIQQVATYPLFHFPYTRLGSTMGKTQGAVATMFRRRSLLKILERIFYDSGFERSSVWAFTKKEVDKYCSVTVPSYIGLGASGSSYLRNIFYVNTFRVNQYIKTMNQDKLPVALSVDLNPEMQMSAWLYWRIYETKFRKSNFEKVFETDFDEKYGKYIKILNHIGYLKNGNDEIKLTDKGTYWLHAFEDFFSIDYINKLWGTSKSDPWPEKVVL